MQYIFYTDASVFTGLTYLTRLSLDDIISYALCGCLVYVSVSIG